MPIFTLPLMLIAAAALPTVAAIYWLRNRFRRHPVSSLMLWVDHRRPREGGARMQKLQTPLLFLLELLAVALLVIAAAGPRWLASRPGAPLMVILDDSFSMRATDETGESARDRAIAALRDELDGQSPTNARFILAGEQPQVIGETIRAADDVTEALQRWRCDSAAASIAEAVTFASQLGGPNSRLLVLTDREPTDDLAGGRTQWWAFGEPRPNFAIVNAARQHGSAEDRLLLEIANLSADPNATQLSITEPARQRPLREDRLSLGPGETRRLTLALPAETGLVRIELADDALPIDNVALLPPNPPRPVAVQVAVQNESLRRDVRRALGAMDHVTFAPTTGDLVITDDPARTVRGAEAWAVYLIHEGDEPRPYVGPFVVDKAHPIGDGLSLAGVIWSAPAPIPGSGDAADTGRPIVLAGNVPLITTHDRLGERRDIHIRLAHDLSTLSRTVNWPILWWNIVDWRGDYLPGLERTVARLGTSVTLVVDREASAVQLTHPAGEVTTRPVGERRITIPVTRPGLWTAQPIYDDDREAATHRFAVNAIGYDESNLADAATARQGRWIDAPTLRKQYIDTAWVFALLALALLGLHLFLVNQSSRAGVRT